MTAVISDANEELINCYLAVRNRLDELIHRLNKLPISKEHFLRQRKIQPWELDEVGRAARLIYLNKTCFNGLYRVNQRGEFNVPYGDYKNPRIFDPKLLEIDSKALQQAEVICRDFRHLLYKAQPTDFVYFDPPYHPLSDTSSFTSYSEAPFGEREQKALRQVFEALDDRGCHLMLSNSDTPRVRQLYKEFKIEEVQVTRAINSKVDRRGKITELIVRNY